VLITHDGLPPRPWLGYDAGDAPMKGPPITVKCDCGRIEHVPYGDTWTCEDCGRRWNTRQIPIEEYSGIMREQRRFRFEAMIVGLLIGGAFVIIGLSQPGRVLLLVPIAFAVWFIWYMPRWRRKVRQAARSLPTWHLTPEP
jgi:hypothetical protein